MTQQNSVYSEVRRIIAGKIERGETVVVDWVTHEIIASKAGIEGPDVEFYRICAFTHVKDVVKRCVGRYDAKPASADQQLVLAGFEHLQTAYTVLRGGEVVLVPVDQLTDEEVEDRAKDLDAMALGCRAHARELRSYSRERLAHRRGFITARAGQ
ncbi:hypothetical protein [Mesorhizobium sp.]|uniref:hypothetical protein n=1 Tax=Mesorhizobium sp. TaxID=1871066 RepID=UPI000FE492B8|nr:hypothetical protein [Mesorhizobium sp.]RWD23054.1 MAG: hypothetical protein EOS33_27230 [Mesorhizobium sp.]